MTKLNVPILTNSLEQLGDPALTGTLNLVQHSISSLVVNSDFDEYLICYDQNYSNDSSSSSRFVAHLEWVHELLASNFKKHSHLVEIGCGQGGFLQVCKTKNYFIYKGFDKTYDGDDPNIEKRYLSGNDLLSADLIVLRHTLEHIKNPGDFLQALNSTFVNDPLIYIEVPDLTWIEKNSAIFDFTYEHVNYFNKKSLGSLFNEVLQIGNCFDGQYLYCIAKLSSLLNSDDRGGWSQYLLNDYVDHFQRRLRAMNVKGNLWIWGAATKGVMFSFHLELFAAELFPKLKGAVDLNVKKQGLFLPVTKVPVISDEQFFDQVHQNDTLVIMNSAYKNEIVDKCNKSTYKKFNISLI